MSAAKLKTPVCPKCGNTTFEMQELKVRGAEFPHSVINCSGCGAIMAIMEGYNVNWRLEQMAIKMGVDFYTPKGL